MVNWTVILQKVLCNLVFKCVKIFVKIDFEEWNFKISNLKLLKRKYWKSVKTLLQLIYFKKVKNLKQKEMIHSSSERKQQKSLLDNIFFKVSILMLILKLWDTYFWNLKSFNEQCSSNKESKNKYQQSDKYNLQNSSIWPILDKQVWV